MPQNRFDRATSYQVYVLIILLMVGGLLSWQAWSRTDNFTHFHQQLAATSVKGAADELEILLPPRRIAWIERCRERAKSTCLQQLHSGRT
jgi:hypothetical protein